MHASKVHVLQVTVPFACLQADVQALQQAVAQASGDVDILLTCEWPLHVTAALPPTSAPAHSPGAKESPSILINQPACHLGVSYQ